jgi:O-methyltransferase involved in polyketide biosynthesis
MNNVNKTLYIPLFGKAYISQKGIILRDPKAEEIWEKEGFPLKGKSKSKWLAYYMGMRAAVFDRWLGEKMAEDPQTVVLHMGCGMDSRILRVGHREHLWYDVDFPQVISQRRHYYTESEYYRMLGANVADTDWCRDLPRGNVVVVMEGISMYLSPDQLLGALSALCAHFDRVHLMMDCYTPLAAKASRVKNPINDVGVTQVYGMDDPKAAEQAGLRFLGEHEMTPQDLIDELKGSEKRIFRSLYAGRAARRLYRLYEYRSP